MALRQRTPEELRAQARHVLYEIQMLSAIAGYIRTGEVDQAVAHMTYEGVPARNAIVEAFELHARNLIEFLVHQRGGSKSTAGDFTREPWQIPADAAPLRKLRVDFSERVAHLSWTRSTRSDQEQVVATNEIFAAIARNLETFFEQVDPAFVGDDFVRAGRFALVGPPAPEPTSPLLRASPYTGGTATQGISPPHDPD